MTEDKEFLTYRQQMKKLRDDKKIQCEGSKGKQLLCRAGYFNLVNGYKGPFIAGEVGGKHTYIGGTTIEHLYDLKRFDEQLRILLLKNIVLAEEEIRTFAAYKFDQINSKGEISWYDVNAYNDHDDTKRIVALISKAYSEIGRSKQSYVQFYMDNHKFIPTWILVKAINFSTFIDFVSYSKDGVKKALCELYSIKDDVGACDYDLLIGSLHWLRKVRNSCAHNERIYSIHRDNGRILNCYFDLLPRSYHRERTQKILDLLLYLKFYLDKDDYRIMIQEIKALILDLESKLSPTAFRKVRADLGIKDLTHLELLLTNEKKIEYNKYEKFGI